MQADSLDLVDTEYSACTVSTCPTRPHIVACGLYQILPDEAAPVNEASPATKRVGRCLLMSVDDNGKIHEHQRVETNAILDMAWSGNRDVNYLALADAAGQICLYDETGDSQRGPETIQATGPSKLCLSLDWNNRFSQSPGAIVTSISDGSVALLRGESSFEVTQSWPAHDYEAWIAAWDYLDCDNCVWTGGDDCKLKLWDLRQDTHAPAFINSSFSAGVTSIQCHTLDKPVFAVGGYDAIVRIFDRRNIKTPMMEHDVGGGVWRLRWNPEEPSMLLAACMHDGFKVLDVDLNASSITTELRFDAHGKDALAYGADWCRVSNMRKSIVCSCSFYDHQLRTWPTPCPSQLTT